MSLNSSESKTSPHSRHSTNSMSSCRETMRTRGCLQTVAMVSEFVLIRLTLSLHPDSFSGQARLSAGSPLTDPYRNGFETTNPGSGFPQAHRVSYLCPEKANILGPVPQGTAGLLGHQSCSFGQIVTVCQTKGNPFSLNISLPSFPIRTGARRGGIRQVESRTYLVVY
jgi:hypothetical protein